MKPSHLQRHLLTNHSEMKGNSVDFVKDKDTISGKAVSVIHSNSQFSKLALETSRELTRLKARLWRNSYFQAPL